MLHAASRLDILKLDIEAGEFTLFNELLLTGLLPRRPRRFVPHARGHSASSSTALALPTEA